ncbi:hypothetical protein IHE45_01G044300 [Dioscorea alata]|uniref:Uncharacterized protein n=1 Tax=Dioscorea alata TaxID=55571 RepID=A0ACB7WUI7_DIOAL|nr:hypothetical protein IHE45_01G044300 [Dioscorea alata]
MDGLMESSIGSLSSSFSASDSSSSSSADFLDDATSSLNKQPLYQMSSIKAELPIKKGKGLSKYYQGKAQSFTSLSDAKSLEDLVKPVRMPYKKKVKSFKSNGGKLEGERSAPTPLHEIKGSNPPVIPKEGTS